MESAVWQCPWHIPETTGMEFFTVETDKCRELRLGAGRKAQGQAMRGHARHCPCSEQASIFYPAFKEKPGLLDVVKVSSHPATSVAHPAIKLKGIKHEHSLRKALQMSVRTATAGPPSLFLHQLGNGLLKLQGWGVERMGEWWVSPRGEGGR